MGVMWLIPILAVCALVFAAYKASYVSHAAPGTPRMQEISAAIAEGADAFLMSEYKILAIFIVVLFLLIGYRRGRITLLSDFLLRVAGALLLLFIVIQRAVVSYTGRRKK